MIHTCPHCGAILKDGNVDECQWCGKEISHKQKLEKTKIIKIGIVVFIAVAVIAASLTMMILI